ncbi:MAG: DNA repair protein RadC [Solobacterium sp.]|nr:DNA repair protein RadC [Solobacterium sp.]
MTTKLKNMPEENRPRERGMKYGPENLTTRELLAVLIRCGTKGQSALETADKLLKVAGDLNGVARMPMEAISGIRGLSMTKALELKSCFELSRRMMYEDVSRGDPIQDPEALEMWLRSRMGALHQEEFMVVFLDYAHHVIAAETLFIGTASASLVSSREIYQRALERRASFIMLAHNHPSGSLEPSEADLRLTRHVMEAGLTMDVPVLDHLIISDTGCLSMRREGYLEECMTKQYD